MNQNDVRNAFEDLFKRAKGKDEFDYVCALLRIRGAEGPGWDPLIETSALFQDIIGLSQAPLNDFTRVRLLLLLYCHLTEVDAIYIILYNMISICNGGRYNAFPFMSLYSGKTINKRPPSAKMVVNYLKKHAEANGELQLLELLKLMFNDAVRNAFFHSDYILFEDEFRTREGEFENTPNCFSPTMKFTQLEDIVNNGVFFYLEFMNTFRSHGQSYKKNQKIKGRFSSDDSVVEIELLADKNGLYGFQST